MSHRAIHLIRGRRTGYEGLDRRRGGPDSEIEELRGEVRRAHDRIDQLVELLRQAGVEDVEGANKEN